MSRWRRDLDRFWTVRVDRMSKLVFLRTVALAFESVTVGSAITASPGQPVDTGFLRASWQIILPGDLKGFARIATNTAYAPVIEDGIGSHGPLALRSQVGGFHSVKLTVAGYQRIVAAALAEYQAGTP